MAQCNWNHVNGRIHRFFLIFFFFLGGGGEGEGTRTLHKKGKRVAGVRANAVR